jgi:hypothetical protein
VSGGAHARDASATLGSLGPCEMPGAGVNPVWHVSQSVPTGNASGGPWDPPPAPPNCSAVLEQSAPMLEPESGQTLVTPPAVWSEAPWTLATQPAVWSRASPSPGGNLMSCDPFPLPEAPPIGLVA